jgi:hypothetical protein
MEQQVILESLVNFLVGVLFIWTGFFIYNRKHYQLIIGYNVLNEELQRRVDITNFSKHIKYATTAMGTTIAFIPASLKISGFSNYGVAFLWILGIGAVYSVYSFFRFFNWRLNEQENLQS